MCLFTWQMAVGHLIGKNDIWDIFFWATANLLPQKNFHFFKKCEWVCGDIFQYHWVKVQLAFTTEKHQSKPILICSMFLLASLASLLLFLHTIYIHFFFSYEKKTSVTSFSLVIVHKKGFLWSSYTRLYGFRMQFP